MKKIFKLFALSAMAFVAACSSAPETKTVYVKDYITEEMKGDAYPGIRLALEECLKYENSTLVFPGDTLYIKDKYCF